MSDRDVSSHQQPTDETAAEFEQHVLDYALTLNEQMSTLRCAYDRALKRWTAEYARLQALASAPERPDKYVAELENELFAAWRELEITVHAAAERERRFVIDLAQFRRNAEVSAAAARQAEQQCAAQRERADAEAHRAAAAIAERKRLADVFSEACNLANNVALGAKELQVGIDSMLAQGAQPSDLK